MSLRDVAAQASYNLKTISLCVIAGVVVGALAAILSPPRFSAESLVLVRVGAAEAAQEGLNGPQTYQGGEAVLRGLRSEVQIVRSDPVIRAALSGMTRVETRADPTPRAIADFARALKVEVEDGSNVLRITYTGRDRAQALVAVQAVLDAYGERRADLFINASRERQDSEIARYGQALGTAEGEIQRVRQDFDVLDIDKDIALASERLDALTQRAGQAQERRVAVTAELSAISRQSATVPARVLDSQERTNTTPNDEARNTLLRLRQDRAHMVEQYASDWPGLAEIDARIAAAQAQIVENSQDIRSSDRTVRNPVADLLATRRATLSIELASLQRQQLELASQVSDARLRVTRLRDAQMRLHDLERDRSASETIHRSLLIGRAGASLQDQAVDDHNTTLRVVQPPTAPQKGRDLRPTLMLAGTALGIGLAVAATAVGIAVRQVFVTAREAEVSLGLDALMVVDDAETDLGTPAGRAAAERLAAVLLDVSIDGRRPHVIQLVGDDPVAKSGWGLAVARAMAANGPGPVLLVDPDAAEHFRRKAGDAIQRLTAGAKHLDVAQSASPGLWAVVNPAETPLATPSVSPDEARVFLDLISTAFARILVVGGQDVEGPVSRRLHAMVDATVLIVRAEATRTQAALRIRETVLASGGDVLGFVFTGRRRHIPEALYRWL